MRKTDAPCSEHVVRVLRFGRLRLFSWVCGSTRTPLNTTRPSQKYMRIPIAESTSLHLTWMSWIVGDEGILIFPNALVPSTTMVLVGPPPSPPPASI